MSHATIDDATRSDSESLLADSAGAATGSAPGTSTHGEELIGSLPNALIVSLPGVDLLVRDTGGEGTPIVLLHANTGTSESWMPQYSALSRAGYRIVAFDRRGWGGSVAHDRAEPSSIAGDLDALAIKLDLPPFHLVGVAAGGAAVLDYLGWRPERVRSAVVAASSGAISDQPFIAFEERIRISALASGLASDLELGASYRGTDPAGTATWSKIEARSRQPGMAVQPLLHSPNTVKKLESITTPLLAIVAGADLLAPLALIKMWADHVPGHRSVVVASSGHSVAWEQPEVFNGLVLEFIAGL